EAGSAGKARHAGPTAGLGRPFDSGVLAVGAGKSSDELLARWCSSAVQLEIRGAAPGDPCLTVNGGPERFLPEALATGRSAHSPWVSAGHWNLAGRRIEREGQLLLVEGQIVRSFNFRGFDPTNPFWLSSDSALV